MPNDYDKTQDWLALGDFHRQEKNVPEAIEAYLKAVESTDPRISALGWSRLLHIWIPQPMIESVAERYAALAERDPINYRPMTNLGRLLSFNQQPQKAIAAYREGSRRRAKNIHKGQLPPDWDDNSPLLPHYIIIGAQKCGTSSLNSYLNQHPAVLPSIIKETQFFSEMKYYEYGPEWYLSHFPRLKSDTQLITGEASPQYFHVAGVPQRMAQLLPNIKLIVLLRSPSDRFISHYHHWLSRGYDSCPLEETVQASLDHWQNIPPHQVKEGQVSFNRKYYPDNPDEDPGYFYRGLYAYHLQRWLDYFPREQMLVLLLNEMVQSPSATFNRVCDFLGIPNYDLEKYQAVNQGRYSGNSKQDQFRDALAEAFALHDQQLEALLGRSLPWR